MKKSKVMEKGGMPVNDSRREDPEGKYDADQRAEKGGADVVPMPLPVEPASQYPSYKLDFVWDEKLKPKKIEVPAPSGQ